MGNTVNFRVGFRGSDPTLENNPILNPELHNFYFMKITSDIKIHIKDTFYIIVTLVKGRRKKSSSVTFFKD